MENTKKNSFLFKTKTFLILYKLTKSLVAVLFLFIVLLFSFYLIGNYQNFLDKSLLLILNVLSIVSILCTFFSFCGLLENIFFMFTKESKIKNLISILIMFFCIIISIFIEIYSTIIKEIAIGIN